MVRWKKVKETVFILWCVLVLGGASGIFGWMTYGVTHPYGEDLSYEERLAQHEEGRLTGALRLANRASGWENLTPELTVQAATYQDGFVLRETCDYYFLLEEGRVTGFGEVYGSHVTYREMDAEAGERAAEALQLGSALILDREGLLAISPFRTFTRILEFYEPGYPHCDYGYWQEHMDTFQYPEKE